MKWVSFIAALLVLGTVVAGCNAGTESTSSASPAPSTKAKFKVALLTPSPTSDAGWSANAYAGLKAIEKDMGAEVSNKQSTGTQIKDDMRAYAQDGFNLIIGHGFEYNEPGVDLAKDFPKVTFISSSGGKFATNAGAFRFYLEQGFYLAGYTAGLMSKTGTVAMIGGPNIPPIESTFQGFEAGAKAARPDIKVVKTYTGKDDDIAAAKQATEAAIGQGADFVIHQANAAASGVFQACEAKGVYAFGANADQNTAGKTVLGSAVIVSEPAFKNIAQEVQAGTYKGEIRLVGMDTGAIDFIWNPALADKVPADVKTKLEEVKKKIVSGELVVPKMKF